MPDAAGRLSDVERDRINSWLEEKWLGTKTCPVCGLFQWVMPDHVVQVEAQAHMALPYTPTQYPQVMLVCRNCAHTLFFNTVAMGITPATPTLGGQTHGLQ